MTDRRAGVRRSRAIARVARRQGLPDWVLWALLATGVMAAMPVWAQPGTPEVVRPRSDAPTLPPRSSDGPTPQPRSENPLANGETRPVPDSGVIAPPVTGQATPVIRPPSVGTMPVIPPPGAPGGDRSVTPK